MLSDCSGTLASALLRSSVYGGDLVDQLTMNKGDDHKNYNSSCRLLEFGHGKGQCAFLSLWVLMTMS